MTPRYYIEVHENGHRIPAGDRNGYDSKEAAIEAAERLVDDALPDNTVHVLMDIGHAYFGGDGDSHYQANEM